LRQIKKRVLSAALKARIRARPTAQSDPIQQEIRILDPELISILPQTDSAGRLAALLPTKYPPEVVAKPPGDRVWELAGLYLLRAGRSHEAFGLFWALYLQMLKAQENLGGFTMACR